MPVPYSLPLGAISKAMFLITLGILTLMLAGCGEYTDVTNDPAYGFSGIAGTWKTKVPLLLLETDNGLFLRPDPSPGPAKTLATLPIGTELRVEHLINDRNTGLPHVTGSLTSGPYAGKEAWLVSSLFVRGGEPWNTGKQTRSVAPDKLGK